MTNVLNKSMLKRMLCFLLIVLLCFMWCGEVYRASALAPVIYFVLTMIFCCGITFATAATAFTAAEEFCNFLQGKDATLYSSLMGGTEVAKENGKWVVSNAFAGKLATIIHYIYEFFNGNSITKTGELAKGDVIQIGESSVYCLGEYTGTYWSYYVYDDIQENDLGLSCSDMYSGISVYDNSGGKYTYSLTSNYDKYLVITFPDGSHYGGDSDEQGQYFCNGYTSGQYAFAPVIVFVDGVPYFTIFCTGKNSGTVADFNTYNAYYIALDDIADVQIESETIDVYHERGALDEETVANAWKAYGDARIAREEAVTISDAVVSDALTNDTVSSLTQSEVLTDTGVIEGVDPGKTPILDDYQASTDFDGMKVELKDLFPFCVPFDVFDIVKNLQAGREAPSFSYEFKFDKIGLDYTFNIDLSEFDTVAAILRTMELIAFCVGLALITRQIIRS